MWAIGPSGLQLSTKPFKRVAGAPDGGVPMKKQQPSSSACPVIIKVRINNTPQTAIVDTGAATTSSTVEPC
ncbi:unnamed protein product [Didymodactylos carnosus]|uniref:Uncharacterized protein n=2 Tax=Didymodactylos carnosus TaxID=1234261 RepID=A0A816C0T5_9BILA|nr:unnamed protein product [Didymodactylos carnosus]CAF4503541.1 unnamed protein product [Didymodactylos carnosus]